ncbi:B3 domain-containing transcription factor ABI3-like [Olea europaea var. sylvestris]|uniref:B3 domain-containing transcription factor ABI3-like n=1 Tax=Olea europaea var. sylvestris TaxID=158386 RepID=UPI000C1CF7B3|nr:B3 domain-containing transcription factor ABI3-like [Olea europaea var. sylvestris]
MLNFSEGSMIKNKGLLVEQDLQSGNEVRLEETMAVMNPNDYDAMEIDRHLGERDLWLDGEQENLLDLNDATIFYNDFPPLPDFPCMSSSSSSSSTHAPKTTVTITSTTSSSSASSASRADSFEVLKSDADEDTHGRGKFQLYNCDQLKPEPNALSSTASMEIPPPPEDATGDVDCINVMENFGYMDLIDSNEIWDPSSVFQSENPLEYLENQQAAAEVVAPPLEGSQHVQKKQNQDEENDGFSFLQGNSELAIIFFEWLKQNKDHISAEDMRNIKLKRSTIESASKRLGSNKEGKKQLLKLILEWVEQYQLQKKRLNGGGGGGPQSPFQQYQEPDCDSNPNFNFNSNSVSDPNARFSPSLWMAVPPPPPLPYIQDSSAAMVTAPPALTPPPPSSAYRGDSYSNGVPVPIPVPVNPPVNQVINGIPYPYPPDFQMMEHAQSWPSSQFPISSTQYNPYLENGYIPQGIPQHQAVYNRNPYQIFDTNGERLVRLGSSATKEARKKRMARQKRLYPHHHRHHSHQNQHHNQTNVDQNAVDGGENISQGSPSANWVYWSPPHTSSPSTGRMITSSDASQGHNADRPSLQQQNYERQASSNRMQQQSWKTEKNLKFLLQKVLKQSDVGNLGRIVLPKKEAENHLPELESRDGISIAMEDIGTSRVWNMRYRFWPNNKSRMYLLENTGDFVRLNGLQEGDFIVIYSDTKCGKYMIRGVKVRQPGMKLEGKKPVRRNMRNLCSAGHGPSSLAFSKRAVR